MQRRKFLKNAAASSAAFTIVPSFVLGKGKTPPSDTLYVAAFGVGGRGAGVMNGLDGTGKVKYVALCDVDYRRAANSFGKYADVPNYKEKLDAMISDKISQQSANKEGDNNTDARQGE